MVHTLNINQRFEMHHTSDLKKSVNSVAVQGERLCLEDVDHNPHLPDVVRKEAEKVKEYTTWKEKYLKDREKCKLGTQKATRKRQLSLKEMFPKPHGKRGKNTNDQCGDHEC